MVASATSMPMHVINYKPASGAFCHDYGQYGYPGESNLYLCRDGYVVAYNCDTKQPDYVIYRLTAKSVSSKMTRNDSFEADLSIPKNCRSELSDYSKSGYDRGHLAPYAAMDFSQQSAEQSFLLSNMSPQKAGLNRQGWAELEKYVRFWAKSKGEIYVYTGVIYKKMKPQKFIGKNKVAVPDYFYKIIYAPKQQETIAFVMPNASVSKKDVAKYRVSIVNIEQRTGLKFLTSLRDSEREKLISKVSKMWRTTYKH